MTRMSCPNCQLRFTSAAAAILTTCPDCGRELQAAVSAEAMLGYRLFEPFEPEHALPMAVEVALPLHDLRPDGS
jgi:predicted  nucleic acid-binding Zn-ribbon protein